MTETLFKLTRPDLTTRGGFQWEVGREFTAPGGNLCSSGVLHAYRTPILAAFTSPIHNIDGYTELWRAEGVVCADDGLKVGCTSLTLIERADLPVITTAQRVRAAIYIAKQVYDHPNFVHWANSWLDGSDRSAAAARAEAAAWEARAEAAAWAARAAAAARAEAAAWEAAWAAAWEAAWAAAWEAARAAAWAAARAAAWEAKNPINLDRLIQQAMKDEPND